MSYRVGKPNWISDLGSHLYHLMANPVFQRSRPTTGLDAKTPSASSSNPRSTKATSGWEFGLKLPTNSPAGGGGTGECNLREL